LAGFQPPEKLAKSFMTKQHNDYYTYAYLREDKTPYYIGKGRGRRIYSTARKIKPPKDKSRIIFLKTNLTEAEAFKHEIYMIAILGRKDLGTGILRNLTNGGDGASGAVISEEHKEKISLANRGRIKSEEGIRKIGEAHKGVPLTEEHKKKISEAQKGNTHALGMVHTEESRRNMSEARKGKPSLKKGKPLSKDTRRKMSESHKGKTFAHSEETKRKMSEARKGKPAHNKGTKWWSNGVEERMCVECPGEGWINKKLNRKLPKT